MTKPDDEIAILTRWAAALDRTDQDRLLLALANVVASEHLRPRAQLLFEALMPALAADADPRIRRETAHRIAPASWSPAALVSSLASDADYDTQLLLARSSALDGETVELFLDRAVPDILLVVASNRTAALKAEQLDRLIEAARYQAALRGALAHRRELEPEQARRLAAWVSPPLRRVLARRFDLSDQPEAPEMEPVEAQRLVDKIDRAGRLSTGYALRALRQGRLGLFEQTIAALGGVSDDLVRHAKEADDPFPLALACAAGGVDRAVFPEVLREVQTLNSGRPPDAPTASAGVIGAFARTRGDAAEALRAGHARRSARWSAG